MLQQNQIKVSPCRQNNVRITKWAPKDFDEQQRNWRKLRKILVKFNGQHATWRPVGEVGLTSSKVDFEAFTDIPMDESTREIFIADLEAAGYDVIDQQEVVMKPKHPYRESKTMKIKLSHLKRIIKEIIENDDTQEECTECGKACKPDPRFTGCVCKSCGDSLSHDLIGK